MPVNPGDQPEISPETSMPFIENLFKVYPNPTTGAFTLELNGLDEREKIRVDIYGMKGESVFSTELSGATKHELTLSGKPAGIYLVKVSSNKTIGVARIVRQ